MVSICLFITLGQVILGYIGYWVTLQGESAAGLDPTGSENPCIGRMSVQKNSIYLKHRAGGSMLDRYFEGKHQFRFCCFLLLVRGQSLSSFASG